MNLYPNPSDVTGFLHDLFLEGVGYSTINTARSALSSFINYQGKPIGQNTEVCDYCEGVKNKKPPLPRYCQTWDLDQVLDYLKSDDMWPLKKLSLIDLGRRLAMLLSLTSGKRGQNLHLMSTDFMVVKGGTVRFDIRVPVKNFAGSEDVLLQQMVVRRYPPLDKLCPLTTLVAYLKRTEIIRGNEKRLFLSSKKPHGPVCRATIARWVRDVMGDAGIDTSVYAPHSARSATVSKAIQKGVPVETVISRAGWKSGCCFAEYYLKPIEIEQDAFQAAILTQSSNNPQGGNSRIERIKKKYKKKARK